MPHHLSKMQHPVHASHISQSAHDILPKPANSLAQQNAYNKNPSSDSQRLNFKMNSVAILMSTYNGGKYIEEQISSILPQLGLNDEIFIRDDGSKDNTVFILNRFNDSRITIHQGENIGFARSFFWLIYNANLRHSTFMLADQDDIWLPGKIERASDRIANQSQPILYCTRLELVDDNLAPLGLSPNFNKQPQLWNALCENIVTGCTAAINRPAMDLIRRAPLRDLLNYRIVYHDWWLYLCLSAFGAVIFDPIPSIKYRQHRTNMVGMRQGIYRYLNIIKLLKKQPWTPIMIDQIQAFSNLYSTPLKERYPIDAKNIAKLYEGNSIELAIKNVACRHYVRQHRGGLTLLRALFIMELIAGRLHASTR